MSYRFSNSLRAGAFAPARKLESQCRLDFPHLSRTALEPTQPPVQWIPGHSRGKERPGRNADPSPPSSAVAKKG
jgi:hypothetical protein